jgi:adenine specific DNA methylase Mod
LDPFCRCGTTVEAAQALNRRWIGIDISYYAVRLIEKRIRVKFADAPPVPIDGTPADFKSAEALADNDKYGFQQVFFSPKENWSRHRKDTTKIPDSSIERTAPTMRCIFSELGKT